MSTLSILRNALKLNAEVIHDLHLNLTVLRLHAAMCKKAGEMAYHVTASNEVLKVRVRIAKAALMQKRMKTEIAAIFRVERIQRKYVQVFGKLPVQQLTTTVEQEHMLDTLLAERKAADSATVPASAALH